MVQVVTRGSVWTNIEGTNKQVRCFAPESGAELQAEVRDRPFGYSLMYEDDDAYRFVYVLHHYQHGKLDETIGIYTDIATARRVIDHFTPNVRWDTSCLVAYIDEANGKYWELNRQRVNWEPDKKPATVDMASNEHLDRVDDPIG